MSLDSAQRALPQLHAHLLLDPCPATVLFDENGRYVAHSGALPFAQELSVRMDADSLSLSGLPLHAYARLCPVRAYGRRLAAIAFVASERGAIEESLSARWMSAQIEQFATLDFEIDNLSRELAEAYESIHLLCDASTVGTNAENLEQLGLRLVELLTRHIQCRAGGVLLRDPRGGAPVRLGAAIGAFDMGTLRHAEWGRLIEDARPESVVQSWSVEDPTCTATVRQLLEQSSWRNALAAPMCVLDQVIGLLVLADRVDSEGRPADFDSRDSKLVDALAMQGAAMIHGMRTFDLSKEMEIARRIQHQLLPRRLPDLAGWDLAASCSMAHTVGGDLYWVERLADRRIAALVADVSGHDLGSALLMATARAQLRILLPQVEGPAEAMTRLNRHLYDDLRSAGLFLTLFIVFLDADTGRLRYSAGGHNPPLHLRALEGDCIPLESPGPPAGLHADLEFRERSIILRPDDLLLMYTDGFTEAVDQAHEMFGEERLTRSLQCSRDLGAAEIVAKIEDDVARHRGTAAVKDDGTLLLLKRAPYDARKPHG